MMHSEGLYHWQVMHRVLKIALIVQLGLLFSRPELSADSGHTPIPRVESNSLPAVSQKVSNRQAEPRLPFHTGPIPQTGTVTPLVLFILIALATVVSEDLTCIGAGMLVAQGTIGYLPATLACIAGIYLGDLGLYFLGKVAQHAAANSKIRRWFVKDKQLEKGSKWLERRGPAVIIASRFLPGSRLPVYSAAGFFGIGVVRFSFYFLIATLIWTPILVGLSVFIGEQFLGQFETYQTFALPITLAGIALVWFSLRCIPRITAHITRRRSAIDGS